MRGRFTAGGRGAMCNDSRAVRREFRKMLDAARRTSAACGRCGRALAAGEPVWMSRIYTGHACWQAPTCEACHHGGHWLPTEECGGCGRPVTYRPSRRGRLYAFCSGRCKDRWYYRVRSRSAVQAKVTACAACGQHFVATRRDAATCSSACRQRKYRRRRAGTPASRLGRPGVAHD